MYDWKTRDALRILDTLETGAYRDGTVLRWKSNKRVVPCSVFTDNMLEPPPNQKEAENRENEAFFAEYRKQKHTMSDEDMYEARAAHGPGVKIVNIITGETYTT